MQRFSAVCNWWQVRAAIKVGLDSEGLSTGLLVEAVSANGNVVVVVVVVPEYGIWIGLLAASTDARFEVVMFAACVAACVKDVIPTLLARVSVEEPGVEEAGVG